MVSSGRIHGFLVKLQAGACRPGSCCLHSELLRVLQLPMDWESGLRFSVWEDWVVTANFATASPYISVDVLKNQQVNTGEPYLKASSWEVMKSKCKLEKLVARKLGWL